MSAPSPRPADDRLVAMARWLVSLDDDSMAAARRAVTLDDIIGEARAALAALPDLCTPGHCDRCIPDAAGQHIDVRSIGQDPCEHVGGPPAVDTNGLPLCAVCGNRIPAAIPHQVLVRQVEQHDPLGNVHVTDARVVWAAHEKCP